MSEKIRLMCHHVAAAVRLKMSESGHISAFRVAPDNPPISLICLPYAVRNG